MIAGKMIFDKHGSMLLFGNINYQSPILTSQPFSGNFCHKKCDGQSFEGAELKTYPMRLN
jgi:hypothetical protein